MLGKPPDVIPDDLTAEEYYSLGTWYYDENDFEKARQSLEKAISCDRQGATASKAKRYLGQHVPRQAIPNHVIREFKKLQTAGLPADKLSQTLERLMQEQPSFEWPYTHMADIKLRKGDTESAMALLRKALEINPQYTGALTTMALSYAIDMDYANAFKHLEAALSMSPDDQRLLAFKRALEVLVALDGPDLN